MIKLGLILFSLFTLYSISAQETAGQLNIPERPLNAVSGSAFMESIKTMSFTARENAIKNELLSGNIPNHLREMVEINVTYNDLNSNPHQLKYWVMPDYLAIGSDDDFCRIPMGPITAQTVADVFGASMPTRKLVDNIYVNAAIKLAPVPYAPVGNENEKVEKFILHNSDIQAQFNAANGTLGDLIGGTKKDVVISNKIIDPNRPNHVTIYGWHQLNGQPIQPLTNIHFDTYVDYSHGFRFIDSDIIIDGDTVQVKDILKDDILYKIISDETGPMIQPTYLFDEDIPQKPRSFGLKSENDGEVKLLINTDDNVDIYHIYKSHDGINFDSPQTFMGDEFTISNLPTDSIIYIRLTGENSSGVSQPSEVLSIVPKASADKMLIVNGFDRSSEGNTYDFIRQHGSAIHNNNVLFESATNEAITNRLFDLTNYKAVDFILGDESTADESLSYPEQILVANYLEKGGRLFISGSEIAWDLDYKGNSSDKYFIENYLRVKYSADAPGNISATHYSAEGISEEIFENIPIVNFDNGSHGTINVKYADALIPVLGSTAVLNYRNVTSHKIAGIKYEGIVGNGSQPAKIIYMGFPFETIYPEQTRNEMMNEILDYLYSEVSAIRNDYSELPAEFVLFQNYPNPFNPNTSIEYLVPSSELVNLKIFDILGNEISTLVNEVKQAGKYSITFNAADLPSGLYVYRIQAGDFNQSKKMLLLK